eukprot:11162403-Lingulodinium_polyedra.AAC.1
MMLLDGCSTTQWAPKYPAILIISTTLATILFCEVMYAEPGSPSGFSLDRFVLPRLRKIQEEQGVPNHATPLIRSRRSNARAVQYPEVVRKSQSLQSSRSKPSAGMFR